jgi:hypothetical protein
MNLKPQGIPVLLYVILPMMDVGMAVLVSTPLRDIEDPVIVPELM